MHFAEKTLVSPPCGARLVDPQKLRLIWDAFLRKSLVARQDASQLWRPTLLGVLLLLHWKCTILGTCWQNRVFLWLWFPAAVEWIGRFYTVLEIRSLNVELFCLVGPPCASQCSCEADDATTSPNRQQHTILSSIPFHPTYPTQPSATFIFKQSATAHSPILSIFIYSFPSYLGKAFP